MTDEQRSERDLRLRQYDKSRDAELQTYILDYLLRVPDLVQQSQDKLLGFDSKRTRDIGLTTPGALVKALHNLKEAIKGKKEFRRKGSGKHSSVKFRLNVDVDIEQPSLEDILRAFQIQGRLTWEERKLLNIPRDDRDILVEQALLNLRLYQDQSAHQQILDLYQTSIGMGRNDTETNSLSPLSSTQDIEEYINTLFTNQRDIRKPSYLLNLDESKQKRLQQKANNAITRLMLQAGTGHIRFIQIDDQASYIQKYLSRPFVSRFVQVVVDNNLLNEDYPIYLKEISPTHIGPLPLPRPNADLDKWLFDLDLLESKYANDGNQARLSAPMDQISEQLLSQYATQIEGEFYIRLPLDSEDDQEGNLQRISFIVEGSGLGGLMSQVIRVVNSALFWDIDCLRDDYFPIAHDVQIAQDVVGNNIPSPVWSHLLVKLCRIDTLQETLWQSCLRIHQAQQDIGRTQRMGSSQALSHSICSYEEFSFHDPIDRGDYCDFDALRSVARAALQARLRALRNTKISAKTYLRDLRRRVEQQNILKESKALLSGYPFSSFAMEKHLVKLLLESQTESLESDKHTVGKIFISYAVIDAYLVIIEAALKEGAYRRAYKYLQPLKTFLFPISEQWIAWCDAIANKRSLPGRARKSPLSGALLVRYELCIANYFYILDWREEQKLGETKYLLGFSDSYPQEPNSILALSWEALDRAEQLLTVRSAKYHAINEVSQATFHPFYKLLCNIYWLRAKQFLFYPTKAGLFMSALYRPPTDSPFRSTRDEKEQQHYGQLFLLERSRVYAACDGNPELYVIATAYECWALIMQVNQHNIAYSKHDKDVKEQRALLLRNHALLQYEQVGRQCYYSIKEKSGVSDKLAGQKQDKNYEIDPVPAIQEIIVGDKLDKDTPGYDSERETLRLDMNYLSIRRGKVDTDNPDRRESIYLFGPTACYLFFIRGLYHLHSDVIEEFPETDDQAVQTIADIEGWDKKLEKCYLLFNYAWAIAEDGGFIEDPSENDQKKVWRLKRFSENKKDCRCEHADSVLDLYPVRTDGIAIFGKVFSAACTALRCYTSTNPQEQQAKLDWLLEDLYSIGKVEILKTRLFGQQRYNGRLKPYLDACKSEIQDISREALTNSSKPDLKRIRHSLLKVLFNFEPLVS